MKNRPISVTITPIFIFLNALIWLALGIIIAVNAHPALPVPPELKAIMAFLSIVMAGILVGLFVLSYDRGNRMAYYLTIAFFICRLTPDHIRRCRLIGYFQSSSLI